MGPQVTPSLPFLPLPLGSVILLEDILILHAFYFTLLFSFFFDPTSVRTQDRIDGQFEETVSGIAMRFLSCTWGRQVRPPSGSFPSVGIAMANGVCSFFYASSSLTSRFPLPAHLLVPSPAIVCCCMSVSPP